MIPPQRRRRHPIKEAGSVVTPGPPAAGGTTAQGPPEPPGPPGEPEPPEPPDPQRLFTITGGEDGDRSPLDLVTLIVAREDPPGEVPPEQAVLLELCGAPLSVAEISAYLHLPYSAVAVVLTDMLAADLVQARAPVVRSSLPDRSLLEAVMHGLQKL
ncbi:DUF742 domain-containing protein [Streptomyces cavernae]|uniref:DUF742 domain-containing protein n=1 Tax=Streptomyces cavernae TaxID=2259034 RepID=UPI000FEBD282|nr:DUF742 domain-containing protein [Streptomyces cavernae]